MEDIQAIGAVEFLKLKAQAWLTKQIAFRPLTSTGGWWSVVREPYTGAWQQNVSIDYNSVHTYSTVFACETLIASDIAKLDLRLVALDGNGIWTETESPSFSPLLRKPNRYQSRLKFIEQWVLSKLSGAAYILKQRDQRGVVVAWYVLNPTCVTPLEAPDGSVYFELKKNVLAGLPDEEPVTVPASEIIFDPMYTPYHPLIGVSPITACGLAATQGLRIQENSSLFFGNGSQPGGILTAPGTITDATAQRLKERWETNYTGANVGKIAVLGDGLKFEKMAMSAVDAQLVEQLKLSDEAICRAFHVPPYMVGVGGMPNYNNIQALNQQYYSQCLQVLMKSIELSCDYGLDLPKPYGTEFDKDELLWMDSDTMMSVSERGVKAGIFKPDESRKMFNLGPVKGGDTPYLQQQNYSLAALERIGQGLADVQPVTPAPAPPRVEDDDDDDFEARFVTAFHAKAIEAGLHVS